MRTTNIMFLVVLFKYILLHPLNNIKLSDTDLKLFFLLTPSEARKKCFLYVEDSH